MFPLFVPVPVLSFASPLMSVHADNWNYEPMTEWGEGDLNAERAIRREVATPGRQIGIISEAVVELSDHFSELLDVLATEGTGTPEEVEKCANGLKKTLAEEDSTIARLKRLTAMVDNVKNRERARAPLAVI
jgi:hypothetical protein